MYNRRFVSWISKGSICFVSCGLASSAVHASFIETTIGTAVLNDATAAYYNPASLVLLKNPQIIPQGSIAYFNTQFNGQTARVGTGLVETGSSSSDSHYYSPSLYLGAPVTDKVTIGLAMVSNLVNRNAETASVLRYVQASNSVQDYDLVPAIGIKLNEYFSLGAGVNFSYANFHLQPITGFPSSNIADSQSNNDCDGTGVGANIGLLLMPAPKTLIGFDYRSVTTYRLSGSSVFNGSTQVVSNNYHFKLRAPARSILSISHFVTPKLAFITTVQRFQWSILKNINVSGIAALSGTQPVILNASIPYYMHDTWLLTLGSQYRLTPKWIIRAAGTYNQSPSNGHYQIANGDSIILGVSSGYEINKTITIDGSYAHAFIKDENIDINGSRFLVEGVNKGSRDAVSLKLTFNV